jgi:hypothetical protein
MIIYRPQRGSLFDAMAEAKEFKNEAQMKEYIVSQWNGHILTQDIIIEAEPACDDRIGWKDTRHVCIKRLGTEDYLVKYGCPQCIGMCATDYKN